MKKIICWALFDSETGDYKSTVEHYFKDKIDIYGVGMSHYGKNTDRYLNFDLSDFGELFGGGQYWAKAAEETTEAGYYCGKPAMRKLESYD